MNQPPEEDRYAIKHVVMQDTGRVCFEIWDREEDECVYETFESMQALSMLVILTGTPSPSINQGRWA